MPGALCQTGVWPGEGSSGPRITGQHRCRDAERLLPRDHRTLPWCGPGPGPEGWLVPGGGGGPITGPGPSPDLRPAASRAVTCPATSRAPRTFPSARGGRAPFPFRAGSKGGGRGPVRIHHARLAARTRSARPPGPPECHVRGQAAARGGGADQSRATLRGKGPMAARGRGARSAANPRRRAAGGARPAGE